jgi:hypothetical protein
MSTPEEYPDTIVLSGPLLNYWRKHSALIETLSENEGDPDELALERDWFVGVTVGNVYYEILSEVEWNFFSDILTGGQVATEKTKNGKYALNVTKGYTRPVVEKVLDYLLYDKPDTMMNRFKTNVLSFLPLKVVPRGHAPQKVAAAAAAARRAANNFNGNNNLNYNYNRNNNYNNTTKKNKYKSNIRINNTNNKPYAKTLKSSKGRRS